MPKKKKVKKKKEGQRRLKQIRDNKHKYCDNCKYRWTLSGETVCAYILIMKKRRGCDPMKCKKFEKGEQQNFRRIMNENDL